MLWLPGSVSTTTADLITALPVAAPSLSATCSALLGARSPAQRASFCPSQPTPQAGSLAEAVHPAYCRLARAATFSSLAPVPVCLGWRAWGKAHPKKKNDIPVQDASFIPS